MNRIVRDRRDARWLPSRFQFALFRLFAFARLRRSKPEVAPGLVMVIDPSQSAAENFLVTMCVFIATASFAVALFDPVMSLPAACAAAMPVAALIVQAPIIVCGTIIMPIVRKVAPNNRDNLAANSAILMLLTIGAAIFAVLSDSPARFVGGAFLLLIILNAIASLIVFALRNRIAAEEQRHGVEP